MKPFNYYSDSYIAYPNKLNYITFYVYDEGEVVGKFLAFEKAKKTLEEMFPSAVIQQVLDEENYEEHLRLHSEERRRLEQEFQDDLFDEFGVSDNPKRHKCFALAWENGHAHGHSSVHSHFGDYVELIKD